MIIGKLVVAAASMLAIGAWIIPLEAANPIQLVPVVSGLSGPIFVTNAHDGSNRLFIVEQAGVIKVLQPGSTVPTVFLNITAKVLSGGEQGLLGLTFHPSLASPRRFFVNYTRHSADPTMASETVVAEYKVSATDPNVADTTEIVHLVIPRPFSNHNAGMVEFGPDGYLYISSGDGGSGNDPGNRAQNLGLLLGKIMRIDVNTPNGGQTYSSPPDNPFFGAIPGADEIWAYGLRNTWRFSFDRVGGQLYAGDVGQGAWEEVDIITKGGNYGWRVFEGFHCTNIDPLLCGSLSSIAPILEYGHTGGRCSITGGYVYRGSQESLPTGSYVFADYCTGEIFLLENGAWALLLDTPLNISSFGEDEAGEVYVVALGGAVYRITTGAVPVFSVSPSLGPQGSTVPVTINGATFAVGVNVSAGAGITVTNVVRVSDSQITARLGVAAAATVGARTVTVTNPDGKSGSLTAGFTVISGPPNVTMLTAGPSAAVPGQIISAAWSGIASPTTTDWIGLYLSGTADTAFLAWMFVNCAQVPSAAMAAGACAFTLPGTLAAGPYELRLYTGNGFVRRATSNSLTVSIPTLSVDPATIRVGGTVVAAWAGIPNPTAADWMGLYVPGAADSGYLAWIYVSCTQMTGRVAATGACAFTLPGTLTPGTYQLRLFGNGLFTRLATSAPLTVTASGGPSLGVGPSSVPIGGSVAVGWSGIVTPTSADWIGLYLTGAVDNAYLAWIYVSCTQTPVGAAMTGGCAFAIPGTLAGGTYELRFYANNSFARLATSRSFTVGGGGGGGSSGPGLSVSPATVPVGGFVVTTWSGIASPTSADWIGLYAPGAADTAYLSWIYVSCTQAPGRMAAAGTCEFMVPSGLVPGTYQLRLFPNNTYTRLATSTSVVVTPAGNGQTLGIGPTAVSAGGSVMVAWSGITNPNSTDWVGLYGPSTADTAPIAWIYVSCTQAPGRTAASGACTFPIPGGLPLGTYQFRLFGNNGFARLTTSGPLTVN